MVVDVITVVAGILTLAYVVELLRIRPFFRTRAPWASRWPEAWATLSLLGVIIPWVFDWRIAQIIVPLLACISGQVLFDVFGSRNLPSNVVQRGTLVRDIDGGYSFRVPPGFNANFALLGSERTRIALQPSEGGLTPHIATTIIGPVDYAEPPLEATGHEFVARRPRTIGEQVPSIETTYRSGVRVSVIRDHFELLFSLVPREGRGEAAFESFLSSIRFE